MAALRTPQEMKQRAPWLLLGLLLLTLGLMAYDARDEETKQRKIRVWAQTLARPFQWAVSSAGGTGVGFFQNIVNLRHAATENQQLKEQLAALETEVNASRAAVAENENLRELLELKKTSSYKVVPAQIIARDPNIWFQSLTLDVGTQQGVAVNMPVVTGDGVVGRIVTVTPISSQVMLITDDRAAAGAIIGQLGASRALGTVRGTGKSETIEMRYVSGIEQVNIGDKVYTTGLDKIYPSGLTVGSVARVEAGTATTSQQITIQPAARLNALKQVAVLLYTPPTNAPETLPTDAPAGKNNKNTPKTDNANSNSLPRLNDILPSGINPTSSMNGNANSNATPGETPPPEPSEQPPPPQE